MLASDWEGGGPCELEGDLEALKLVDLDREGLSEYKCVIENLPSSEFKVSFFLVYFAKGSMSKAQLYIGSTHINDKKNKNESTVN